ncbi:2-oxoacid:acceptor oxidoreductase subunit alpha [Candidatus Obscuribacterales bacterium]|nr:2-oxoacid:acceptor oxidoreductase subunit alpha [Candidatus Obscuribacterales bacterium]MBX3135467.1 2-oxoacid:acceptor oxidoreductase subunit alpha [Candidatus Obscuribacterales bacterium]MBX3151562.1 2-oxoacid:acceptor oxidoreductase subunit alpha [Candidatus Obscuribacterales bacterium]
MHEVTIGIAGAAGDGLDKSGDTLARSCGRLGLYVYAYNSYQSIIRGGHIWLKVRIGEEKVYCHGDQLNVLVALNQDSIERHAGEVHQGGAIVFNGDRIKCDPSLVREGVQVLALPINDITKDLKEKYGPIKPIMQNTIAIGAVAYLAGIGLEEPSKVLNDTFAHKGQEVIDLNIGLLTAGYEYAKANAKVVADGWTFSKKRRPFVTGNEAIALAAYAAGCKFYSAYPMTPASTILHWMAANQTKTGILVKQCEDELSVINMAIGAGIAGVRSMCGTAGGGFALMTEAVGMAGIMEVPVICVEVQRGGPSTGLPTKTEQADLWQVYGASQGEFPRLIVAPRDIADAYDSTVEAFNLADKYQLPVLMISDLLLSEHPETVDPEAFPAEVKIDRGEIVEKWDESQGKYKRFKFTESGVSPRAIPGTPNTLYTHASDDHDEESILISDMFTAPPVRRKIMEKRQRKMVNMLKELKAPVLEGPADADVTLVCWGSTSGVVKEAAERMTAQGTKTNFLVIKYIAPFHTKEVTEILSKAKKKISVEVNFTSVMARFIRMETGIAMDGHVNRYDGEPLEPQGVIDSVKEILEGKQKDLDVSEAEAKEMVYHYLRTHSLEKLRPVKLTQEAANGKGEPTWNVEIAERVTGKPGATMVIGTKTGTTHSFTKAE